MVCGSEGLRGVSRFLFFASRMIVAVTDTDSGRELPALVNCLRGPIWIVSGDEDGDEYAVLGRLLLLLLRPGIEAVGGICWEGLRGILNPLGTKLAMMDCLDGQTIVREP